MFKYNKSILYFILIGLIIISLFIFICLPENYYYYSYPETTKYLSYTFFLFSFIALVWLIFKVVRKRKTISLKSKLIYLLIYLISSTFFFSSSQFLIYLNYQKYFALDDLAAKISLQSEQEPFTEIIDNIRHKKSIYINLLSKLKNFESFKTIEIPEKLFFIKTNETCFYISLNDIRVQFWTCPNPIEPDPTHPRKDTKEEKIAENKYYTTIITDSDKWVISNSTQQQILNDFFNHPKVISSKSVQKILISAVDDGDKETKLLKSNLTIVQRRKFSLITFIDDAFYKNFNIDQNYFKSFYWLSRILKLVQVLMAIIFTALIIPDIYKVYKMSLSR